jgi:PAS domain S-box-containing protein
LDSFFDNELHPSALSGVKSRLSSSNWDSIDNPSLGNSMQQNTSLSLTNRLAGGCQPMTSSQMSYSSAPPSGGSSARASSGNTNSGSRGSESSEASGISSESGSFNVSSSTGGSTSCSGTSSSNSGDGSNSDKKKRARRADGDPQDGAADRENRERGRERNREHAKKSRQRKKSLLESLQNQNVELKRHQQMMMAALKKYMPLNEAIQLEMEGSTLHATVDEATEGGRKRERSQASQAAATQGGGGVSAGSLMASGGSDRPDRKAGGQAGLTKVVLAAQGVISRQEFAGQAIAPELPGLSFVITDALQPDHPITWASQGFLNLTGYFVHEVIGRNCRFLQGPETDRAATRHLRECTEKGQHAQVHLKSYKRDGGVFWADMSVMPLMNANAKVDHIVIVMNATSAVELAQQQQLEFDQEYSLEGERGEGGGGGSPGSGSGGDGSGCSNDGNLADRSEPSCSGSGSGNDSSGQDNRNNNGNDGDGSNEDTSGDGWKANPTRPTSGRRGS